MKKFREVIKRPIITEKSLRLAAGENKYIFEVSLGATKGSVKNEIEKIYQVTVEAVRIIRIPPRKQRVLGRGKFTLGGGLKKAVVTLAAGDSIDGFSGGEQE